MIRIERRFPLHVGAAFIVIAAAGAYPLREWGSAEITVAVAIGALLSTCNALVGYALIEYAFERSYTTFLKVVLGGMGLRMACMLGVLMLLIMVFHMHTVGLTVAMLLFMIVYLILEIVYLQRKVDVKNQG
jgi:hypothetical protein